MRRLAERALRANVCARAVAERRVRSHPSVRGCLLLEPRGCRPPRRESHALVGAGRLRDPCPLDRFDRLSPNVATRLSSSSPNEWGRHASSSGRIGIFDFGWTCCRALEPPLRRRASERRAIDICAGNSAGLSNCRANNGLDSSMTLHAAPNADALLMSSSCRAEIPSSRTHS